MDAQSHRATTPERNRYLNIVYFVESARSHTIRINLKHAKYAVAAALIVAAWALGSIVWIGVLKYNLGNTREKLESSLSAVFEYQIKNEKVFELAYPSDSTNSYYSETAQLASNNPIADSKTDRPDITKAPAEATIAAKDQPTAQLSKTPPADAVKNPDALAKPADKADNLSKAEVVVSGEEGKVDESVTPSAEQRGQLISIRAAKLSKTGSKMTLNFAITNSNPRKAEGYIWAIATLTSVNGQVVSIIAPEHAKLDKDTGSITSFKTGYRFSIQRFKDKTFDFRAPSTISEWKMTKLTIVFSDEMGTTTNQVELPVDSLAVSHAADLPVTNLRM